MDHRYALRTAVSFSVRIYRRGLLLGTGIARNISRGGMFVQSDNPHISSDSFVELELMTMSVKRLTSRRLPSLVVHRDPEGFGVMFADDAQV